MYDSNYIIDLIEEILTLYGSRGYLLSRPKLCLGIAREKVLEVVDDIKSYPVFPNFCINIRYQMMLVTSVKLGLQ